MRAIYKDHFGKSYLDIQNCPIAQTAKKVRFPTPDFFLGNDLNTGQIRSWSRKPGANAPQNAFLEPFLETCFGPFGEQNGCKGAFPAPFGVILAIQQKVFVKTTSNSWPLWHFHRPDPLSGATLPGLCAVSFLARLPYRVKSNLSTQVADRLSNS